MARISRQAVRPREKGGLRLPIPHFRHQQRARALCNVGRIRHDRSKPLCCPDCIPKRAGSKLDSPGQTQRCAFARATSSASGEASVATTLAPASCARLSAIAPEPVPRSSSSVLSSAAEVTGLGFSASQSLPRPGFRSRIAGSARAGPPAVPVCGKPHDPSTYCNGSRFRRRRTSARNCSSSVSSMRPVELKVHVEPFDPEHVRQHQLGFQPRVFDARARSGAALLCLPGAVPFPARPRPIYSVSRCSAFACQLEAPRSPHRGRR